MLEKIPDHQHNGIDSSKISPKYLKGFPIFSSVPSHNAPEGTIVLYSDGSTTFSIYVRINQTWKSVAIT